MNSSDRTTAARTTRPPQRGPGGTTIGRFIASTNGAPCFRCGRKIPVGADVYYAGPRLDDDVRTCGECVDTDLFGVLV